MHHMQYLGWSASHHDTSRRSMSKYCSGFKLCHGLAQPASLTACSDSEVLSCYQACILQAESRACLLALHHGGRSEGSTYAGCTGCGRPSRTAVARQHTRAAVAMGAYLPASPKNLDPAIAHCAQPGRVVLDRICLVGPALLRTNPDSDVPYSCTREPPHSSGGCCGAVLACKGGHAVAGPI